MGDTLIWISGASSGIGKALADNVPWDDARIIDISRRGGSGVEHVEADLSDPASWPTVAESFERELTDFSGERVVFVHAAGSVQPIGFAGEVDTEAYTGNVLLNSAAGQVLGHAFLRAARDIDAQRYLVMLSSGAASLVGAGWSSYGAGKAALDQWVRDVGAEQDQRGGVRVVAVAPGVVQTEMQEQIRETAESDFPKRDKFVELHESGQLSDPDEVAGQMWALLERGFENGAVLDLRQVSAGARP
ncbi:MAG: SDR family NAD(P)-dependent oxidoreductase [Actinomycetota bacterium]|nr:SDR family NAD(P)-dependent oxidoreductase [Actinomycetota bacterium]MDQ3574775.1 SDR family NAD(P)-dependent oxidoreductase [Actinomycetota bacterium]